MRKVKIGLALGSGAARGWAHIGIIDALVDAGIVPDIVCGTSMGALVGGIYAGGNLEALKKWALAADRRAVGSLVDVSLLQGGLVDGVRIVGWLGELGVSGAIEDLPLPFAAVATDLESGREVWLQSGPLARSIRASISMPGVFSPVELDGRWLVDGGLVNPVPVSLCRAMGSDFTIAVNLNEDLLGRRLIAEPAAADTPPPKPTNLLEMVKSMPQSIRAQAQNIRLFGTASSPGYFDVLVNSLNIMQDQITRSRLAGEPPHAVVMPQVVDIDIMDFHRARETIERGRIAAEAVIPVIKAKLASRAV